MKIMYGRKTTDPNRMDGIVLRSSELLDVTGGGLLAFRGDDRKPSEIFASGFQAKDNNYVLEGTHFVDDPKSWDDIVNSHAKDHTGTRTDWKFKREKQYTVQKDEICFRPNHLDLQKETCVSLTTDPLLAVGFPLNDGKITYMYAVNLTGKYLPTYKVQEAGGNSNLAKSKEITALEVSADQIIGAAVIHRSVVGSASMATVDYQITLWEANPRFPGNASKKRGQTIDQTILNFTGVLIALKGSKDVSAGMKASGNTASNAVLVRAVEALLTPNTLIQKLAGKRPVDEGVSKGVDALLEGHKPVTKYTDF